MNSELSSRSSIRSLRQLQKIDYKNMNNCDDQTQRGSDKKSGEILEDVGVGSFDENPLGASGTSTGSSEPVGGQVLDPLFDDFDRDQDEAEIQEMQLQMKRLNAIEARLDRKKRLEQMKKELDDQKRRVREMKGKDPPPTKTSDNDIETKTFVHLQSKTSDKGARPKTVEAISKSKAPASTTDADINADIDSEQVTIDSLRQNPKLQKQVKKELSKLGLKVISLKDESSSSESESSDTSSTSDSDLSKKKKKKHKSKKNKTDTETSDSSSSEDSDSSKKKKKKA